MNERKIIGSSYIVNFSESINFLTHNFVLYGNLLTELKKKYGEEINKDTKIESNEVEALINSVQTIRYYAKMFVVQYKTLMLSTNQSVNNEIEKYFIKIKEQYIIEENELEQFVILANSVLMGDIIKDLLVTSQNLISQIYNNDTTSTNPEPSK